MTTTDVLEQAKPNAWRQRLVMAVAALLVVWGLIFGSRSHAISSREIAPSDTALYWHDRGPSPIGRMSGTLSALRTRMLLLAHAKLLSPDSLQTYIATFRPESAKTSSERAAFARSVARESGVKLRYIYRETLDGFAFSGTAAVANALRENPAIASVTRDLVGRLAGTQKPAPWNLDRIDSKLADRDVAFDFDGDGAGIDIYVLDSGVLPFHRDFEDDDGHFRVGMPVGGDLIADGMPVGRCHDHGTQMAGIAAGRRFGIAKAAAIRSIRIADCSGHPRASAVIQGIEVAIRDHNARSRRPAVLNMSLEFFDADDEAKPIIAAIARARQAGFIVVAAAGNDDVNACKIIPAKDPDVVTVGASDDRDRITDESNHGRCVKVFAPGADILSSSNRTDTASAVDHGTSHATAHVSGVLALWLSLHPGASAEDAEAFIRADTAARVQGDLDHGPSGLVQSRFAAPNILLRGLQSAVDKTAAVLTGRPD